MVILLLIDVSPFEESDDLIDLIPPISTKAIQLLATEKSILKLQTHKLIPSIHASISEQQAISTEKDTIIWLGIFFLLEKQKTGVR